MGACRIAGFSVLLIFVLLAAPCIAAPLSLSIAPMFRENMVLQRYRKVPVWGWGPASWPILVTCQNQAANGTVDGDGRWIVYLPPLTKVGGPFTFTVQSRTTVIVSLSNVLVGDVWVGTGQSTFVYPVQDATLPPYPKGIRYFVAPQVNSFTYERTWMNAGNGIAVWFDGTQSVVNSVSTIGYYFAQRLYKLTGVPIGFIEVARGGSQITDWAPPADVPFSKVYKGFSFPNLNTGFIFGGSLAPVLPFAVRGVLQLHGENRFDPPWAATYESDLTTVITGWRKAWEYALGSSLTWIILQVGPYNFGPPFISLRREAQYHVSQHLADVGLVNILDIANSEGGYLPHKQPVGERAALYTAGYTRQAKNRTWVGPAPSNVTYNGSRVLIRFTGGPLTFKSTKSALYAAADVSLFDLCGSDRACFPAAARILDPSLVEVTSADVATPVAVRHAWASVPAITLFNAGGLPAIAFRTDSWQLWQM